jgi:hypothetical protein
MISKRSDEAEAPARVATARGAGQKPSANRGGAELGTATSGRRKSEDHKLMEEVVERSNLKLAYQRVVENKGAPGVDDVAVLEFKDWLKMHWPSVKAALLEGRYMPRALRRVDIPQPSGGMRMLGVPTVVDRLIQQALHQVLQPLFEPTFSDSSYGFRPGRGAHQAVRQAQAYIREGRRWVVDIDLEKFFDQVNHDVLMARVARQVSDVRVLKLIRRFLEAGMMSDGLVEPRTQGTPQGGPITPRTQKVTFSLNARLVGGGHCRCLTCAVNGNTHMAYAKGHGCREGGAIERRAPARRPRFERAGCGAEPDPRVRSVATSSISLRAGSPGDRPSCAARRALDPSHLQSPSRRHSRSACVRCIERTDTGGDRGTSDQRLPCRRAQAWLSANGAQPPTRFASTTPSIDAWRGSSPKRMSFSSQTACESQVRDVA